MQHNKCFLAVDLGATSGRTVVGRLIDGKVNMTELTRFKNPIIPVFNHDYWDLYALYNEILHALHVAVEQHLHLTSIGIDTWGCDFALFGDDGYLLRNPLCYRDPCHREAMKQYLQQRMSSDEVYRITGIQFLPFNSLFQLYGMRQRNNTALRQACHVAFIPDALIYLLTGKLVCEYTVASTSQMLNPATHELDPSLLHSVGLTRQQFGSMVMPATIVASLSADICNKVGMPPVPVVAVAGHDTASAVAAVPAANPHFAYLSSGTWSLMGIETSQAIISPESKQYNFTNEGGIDGTTRFLKNICGMWLYEQCRKEWPDVQNLSHAELQQQALQCEPFRSLINPDDECFANPASMTTAIAGYCADTHQPVPSTHAEFCRCIFDSLALRYRQVFGYLKQMSPFTIDTLHIIGGGSKNGLLNQLTANSCGVTVKAGPQEATALGNIMLQAKAAGLVGNIWQLRQAISASVTLDTYTPQHSEVWDEAYKKYLDITKSKSL